MVAMKNVLVFSYYFPPLGLSGVQRITKFVKYLPEYGWRPTVIAAGPHSYFAFDESLQGEIPSDVKVIRTRSFDPTRWTGRARTVSIPSESGHSMLRSLSNRIFFPDNKRFWMPFAKRAALKQIEESRFDVIFSTAPPFSSHILASKIAQQKRIPLVLDFRDNWVGNPRKVYASERQKRKHQRVESLTLKSAGRVVTINEYIKEDMVSRAGIEREKISIIPQGYDAEDFGETASTRDTNGSVAFVYSGIFYDAQKPDSFLQGLAKARSIDETVRNSVKAVFVGLVPDNFSELVKALNLSKTVEYRGYLDHRESLEVVMNSQIPWMIVGNQPGGDQISTGKLAEYMGSRKPILGLVPDGAAKESLKRYGRAETVDPDDIDGIAEAIVKMTRQVCERKGVRDLDEEYVESLDRNKLAGHLASIFDEVAS